MPRVSLISRTSLLAGACIALPTLFACLDHPLKPVEYEASQEDEEGIQITVNKDVDILFVIDNSGSMGEEQANLGAQFERFLEVLNREEVKANYRIGITTTDNGNPWCSDTSPEGGALRLSSCRARQSEFQFGTQTSNPVDATNEACLDICPESLASIGIIPTTTENDDDEVARPWLQNTDGLTNLEGDVDPVEAFRCFGPQGINGCGFESHLESMWKALVRAQDEDEQSYDFIRSGAILSIVFVTDEADCSANEAYNSIFEREGNQVFWSNPDAGTPSSALCWNAGVSCTGSGGSYDSCVSANLDTEGNPVDNPDEDAVLRPVSRYIDLVQGLEDRKKELNPTQEVLVAAISGVPEGYGSRNEGEITYQDSQDSTIQGDFGIGLGCSSAVAAAVPPVRLREFAEAFAIGDDRNLFSVCSEDYSPALEAIAEAIADQLRPSCMPACVADLDATTPDELDFQCILEQLSPGSDAEDIPECEEGGALPDGADVCFEGVSGDERSEQCVDEGWNLEFRIIRRDGVPAPGGTQVSATCQLSQQKAVDCPDLD